MKLNITSAFASLISIILPCYNRSNFLRSAIESVLNQTYKNLELIIVDDCSQDNSYEIAKSYEAYDPRVKVFRNAVNKKLPATLNVGFSHAKGKYYTWTSDDNIYKLNALERMAACLDSQPDIGLVYADYTLINETGKIGKRIYQESPEFLPIRDCVGACFLYRADIAKQVGLYREDLFLIEDYDYWLRFGLITKLHHIAESLYLYRTHPQSLTNTRKNEIRAFKQQIKKLYADKYNIPPHIKPIDDLYRCFIGDKNLSRFFKIAEIIIKHPTITLPYILKNLSRIN